MVYCTKCGADNEDDVLTCKECDAPLHPNPYKRYRRRREDNICFGPRSNPLWSILGGVFILLLGISFLLERIYGWQAWDRIWPLFIIGFGLVIIFNVISKKY